MRLLPSRKCRQLVAACALLLGWAWTLAPAQAEENESFPAHKSPMTFFSSEYEIFPGAAGSNAADSVLSGGSENSSPYDEDPVLNLSGGVEPAAADPAADALSPVQEPSVPSAEQKTVKAKKAAPKAVACELPAINVRVSRVVYEKVPLSSVESHRRRSLSSRGSHSVNAAPAASYTTKAVRRKVYVDIAPMICKYAKKHNLDPWFVRGVIQCESNFYPYAGSPVGAGGLMQLMPATARSLGCKDRFDPEQNIAAGCRYLRQMLNMFNGNYSLAIAAYNAGPGAVRRYGGVPPYSETRNYVAKVTRAWHGAKKAYFRKMARK